jgi:hypothetical protein
MDTHDGLVTLLTRQQTVELGQSLYILYREGNLLVRVDVIDHYRFHKVLQLIEQLSLLVNMSSFGVG